MLTKDTDLPVRQTMADGSHQLESNQLRAPGGSKHSLAMLVIFCYLPLFFPSALRPGSLLLKTAPSELFCTPSSTWVWSRVGGEAGIFTFCSLPALGRSPEVATSSWKSSPPGSFSSMVLAQNGLKYHHFTCMFPQPPGL